MWIKLENSKNQKIYQFSKPLVVNQEPWIDNDSCQRISAFLDSNQELQLIIGSKRKNCIRTSNWMIEYSNCK